MQKTYNIQLINRQMEEMAVLMVETILQLPQPKRKPLYQ